MTIDKSAVCGYLSFSYTSLPPGQKGQINYICKSPRSTFTTQTLVPSSSRHLNGNSEQNILQAFAALESLSVLMNNSYDPRNDCGGGGSKTYCFMSVRLSVFHKHILIGDTVFKGLSVGSSIRFPVCLKVIFVHFLSQTDIALYLPNI